jgi:hypothetical protein
LWVRVSAFLKCDFYGVLRFLGLEKCKYKITKLNKPVFGKIKRINNKQILEKINFEENYLLTIIHFFLGKL